MSIKYKKLMLLKAICFFSNSKIGCFESGASTVICSVSLRSPALCSGNETEFLNVYQPRGSSLYVNSIILLPNAFLLVNSNMYVNLFARRLSLCLKYGGSIYQGTVPYTICMRHNKTVDVFEYLVYLCIFYVR